MHSYLWGKGRGLLVLAAAGVAIASCGSIEFEEPPPPPPPQNLTYCENANVGVPRCDVPGFDIRQELIGCAGDPIAGGCHSGAEPQLGFEIDTTMPGTTPADWLRDYMSVPATVCGTDLLINPNDPDCSFILTKVTDRPKCGSRMPNIPSQHFSGEKMDCFRKWMHDAFGNGSACSGQGGDDDGDGVCGNVDACPNFNDNIDTDADGTPDGCDLCAGNDTTGDTDMDRVCDDTDVCVGDDSTGDTDMDGVCDGSDVCTGNDTTGDTDMDGVCDDTDVCTGDDSTGDTDMDGVCDDTDACTGNDSTGDTDMDGVCDDQDQCPGFDDSIDLNMNGTPDGCDP